MVTVYFDYLCPFAWRGLELANVVAPKLGFDLELKHYSLVQGNHADNAKLPRNAPAWKLAEQLLEGLEDEPRSLKRSGLMAFLASHAAKRQGKAAHLRFALELFRLRHAEKAELKDEKTLLEATERAGLDRRKFKADWSDEKGLRAELAKDLEDAGELAVFGTPTFVLPSGDAAYFRFAELVTEPETAVRLWNLYTEVLQSGSRIETVKRPRK